ncbi:MAG: hypothetical protein WA571_20170 [Candidatus Binatus sp.]
MKKIVDRGSCLIDGAGAETVSTQRIQHPAHWSVGEWTGHRKTGASFLERDQGNDNQYNQRDSLIRSQSRFKPGELGCEVDGLRRQIEPGDRDFKRAHLSVERGTSAAARRLKTPRSGIHSEN